MSTDAKEHPFQARLKGKWPDDRLAVILGRRLGRMRAYFPAQFQMDRAHTVMLAEEGVLSAGNAKKILGILATLEDGGFDRLCGGGTQSTLFWYVESALIEALGPEVGGRMHTGRSHNDILPTLSRLTARNGVLRLIDCLTQLR